MFVGEYVIPRFGNDLPKLIQALFFIVVGCTSYRNVRAACGTSGDQVGHEEQTLDEQIPVIYIYIFSI